ncbi:MAG: hypothetical protein COV67_02770 [Nitrospinae bacterium CG11_big_fil_rev_8_21_14_0_20_56_8]|nr:MAG: hypothetical protein COV67_02770 [Nitrospinae bacterium CG11_big_fil_rev_8_21_14_0_20_56_8]
MKKNVTFFVVMLVGIVLSFSSNAFASTSLNDANIISAPVAEQSVEQNSLQPATIIVADEAVTQEKGEGEKKEDKGEGKVEKKEEGQEQPKGDAPKANADANKSAN